MINQILVYVLYTFLAVFVLGTAVLMIGLFYKKETPEQKEAKKAAALAKKEEQKAAKANSNKNLVPTEPKRKKRNKEELVITDTREPVFNAENKRANPLAGFVNQPTVTPTNQPVKTNRFNAGTGIDETLLKELQEDDDNIPLQQSNTRQFPRPQHDLDFNTGSDDDEDTSKPAGRFNLPY